MDHSGSAIEPESENEVNRQHARRNGHMHRGIAGRGSKDWFSRSWLAISRVSQQALAADEHEDQTFDGSDEAGLAAAKDRSCPRRRSPASSRIK